MERQTATSLDGIAVDHRLRYYFAADQAKGRILDAASGVGYGSSILRAAVAVDICGSAIEFGKKYYPGPEYICGALEDKPWHGTFDTIVSFETIEHLPRPELVLQHFAESLNPDGVFVCSVPNEAHYPFVAETFKGDEYPHQRHYTPDEFTELLAPWFRVEARHCQRSKLYPQVMEGTEGKFLIYVCKLLP